MSIAYLDTQVIVWLHAGASEDLTAEARKQIERSDLLVSPIVLLELQYLFDKKRVRVEPMGIYSDLHTETGLRLCTFPFPAVAMEALRCTWTKDPFDRIIVSHAKANGDAVLVTADRKIRQHYAGAKW